MNFLVSVSDRTSPKPCELWTLFPFLSPDRICELRCQADATRAMMGMSSPEWSRYPARPTRRVAQARADQRSRGRRAARSIPDTACRCCRGRSWRSAARFALRVHVERIDRVACRHEQAIALQATKTEIGTALGQGDEADRPAGRIEDFHPILLRIAHAPAAPEIAVDVDAEAIGSASRLGGDEDPAVAELVVIDVVGPDEARIRARFDK